MLAEEEAESFWPSFADLTSTIALILFVLVLLAYIQNLIGGKKLEHIKAELTATHRDSSVWAGEADPCTVIAA